MDIRFKFRNIYSGMAILLLFTNNLQAQGLNIGVSLGLILDNNKAIHLPNATIYKADNMHTYFNNGGFYGLIFRYGFNETWGIKSNFYRMSRNVTTTLGAKHDGLTLGQGSSGTEIAFSLTNRKILNQKKTVFLTSSLGLMLNFFERNTFQGGGYVPGDSINTYYFSYNDIQHDNPTPGIKAEIGIEKNYGEYGNLYIGLSYQHLLIQGYRYDISNFVPSTHFSDQLHIRGSYLSLNLNYYLPWRALTGKNKLAKKSDIPDRN